MPILDFSLEDSVLLFGGKTKNLEDIWRTSGGFGGQANFDLPSRGPDAVIFVCLKYKMSDHMFRMSSSFSLFVFVL